MAYNNDEIAALILKLLTRMDTFSQSLYNWSNGTYDGGPTANGMYPLPVGNDTFKAVPCPDRIRFDASKLKIKFIQLGLTPDYTSNGTRLTMTVADADTLFVIVGSSTAQVVAVTLPETLPAGWVCSFIQYGTGSLVFSTLNNGLVRNRQNFDRTAGQGALAVAIVESRNSGGTGAIITLGGDLRSA